MSTAVELHSKVLADFATVIRDDATSPGATPISAPSAVLPILTLVGVESIPRITSAMLPVPNNAASGTRLPSTSPGMDGIVGVAAGVLVTVDVGVSVGVIVAVGVSVAVGVIVGVFVTVDVAVIVGVSDGVAVGEWVGVSVCVGVSVGVRVDVGVFVGVCVGVRVGVSVGVSVAEWVGVTVGVLDGVRVAVAV